MQFDQKYPINTSYKRSNGQKIWFWVAILNLCKLTTFAYLDCSIFLICCSGWVWESVPTNTVYVAILSRSNHRLTGLDIAYVCVDTRGDLYAGV